MKRKTFTMMLLSMAMLAVTTTAQTKIKFKNGVLKIAQFTDIHWTPTSEQCSKTAATIQAVLSSEQPDLAVLTGDIVTAQPAIPGWKAVADIFENANVPFVVVMGNHDAENAKKSEIYDLLLKHSCYMGNKGPDNLPGMGNCILPVYNQHDDKQKPEALIYLIDSGDYPSDKAHGAYDKIHFEQIAWYRHQSELYTRQNNGTPLPALAFFHIPLPEYKQIIDDSKTYGQYEEGAVAAGEVNSGMFSSILDMKDVMGVFAGHDHDNDFLGIDKNVLLAYGRVTGADAYGKFERGARIIKLYENKRKFDTWIATPAGRETAYYYPSGLNSEEEDKMEYLKGITVNKEKQGIAYIYKEGKFEKTEDIKNGRRVKSGVLKNFSITEGNADDHFAYEFNTMLKVPVRGVYRFYIDSDDGSVLFIDDRKVVDNDGGHSAKRVEGKIALEAGYHKLRLLYFEDYMGQQLEVGIAGRNLEETAIPSDMLYLP